MDNPILTPKDFQSDQDIRWCPGCGDYSILKQVQTVLPQIGVPKENIVVISGIGCSSRFPYYMNTYGMHSIHGRATAIASGLKALRRDLSVWIVTGDGDALSIGGNHLIHLLRRNFDVNILLFNNQIYGLTKGQYSPTSEINKVTKSTPSGSIDKPFNTISLALGADATFIARSQDRDPKHLQKVLTESHKHKGSSFLEIYQNCNIFNDGAFFAYSDKATKAQMGIFLEQDQPLVFGNDGEFAIRLDGYKPEIVKRDLYADNDLWIHDKNDLFKAQIISRFFDPIGSSDFPRPFGVIYQNDRPTYDEEMEKQLGNDQSEETLNKIIAGNETWEVS